MKKLVLVLVLVLVLGAITWLRRTRESAPAPPAAPSVAASSPAAAPQRTSRAPSKVTQVPRAERDQLAQRIAAAHAAHGAHSAPARPALPPAPDEASHDVDDVPTHVMEALQQAVPFLADCYKRHPPANPELTAHAQMTLTGDPDLGTVIDADQIYDDKHQPLPRELDDCLRSTVQTLELPPLAEGNSVRLEYSFAMFAMSDK